MVRCPSPPFGSPMSSSGCATALLLLVMIVVSATSELAADDLPVTVDDLKCQACDVAVSVIIRRALEEASTCAASVRPDSLNSDAHALADALPKNCVDVGPADWKLHPDLLESLAGESCQLFLDEFPAIQEFDQPNGAAAASDDTLTPPEPLDPRFINMLVAACEVTMGRTRKHRLTIGASLRETVQGMAKFNGEGRLVEVVKVPGTEPGVVIDKEAADRIAAMQAEDDEGGYDGEGAVEKAEAMGVRLKEIEGVRRERARHLVYRIVLAAQEVVCAKACGSIGRPPHEAVVKGWSATGKRLPPR